MLGPALGKLLGSTLGPWEWEMLGPSEGKMLGTPELVTVGASLGNVLGSDVGTGRGPCRVKQVTPVQALPPPEQPPDRTTPLLLGSLKMLKVTTSFLLIPLCNWPALPGKESARLLGPVSDAPVQIETPPIDTSTIVS